MFQNKNSWRGFTIVEMLIVIAIIAILASLVLVSIRNVRPSAYDARRMADLQKVQTYLEIYYNQNREYPNVFTWVGLRSVLMNAGVATAIPDDPLSASFTYFYGVDTTGLQSYVLGATLSSSNNAVLLESTEVDGTNVFGVNCDDPVFCIRS